MSGLVFLLLAVSSWRYLPGGLVMYDHNRVAAHAMRTSSNVMLLDPDLIRLAPMLKVFSTTFLTDLWESPCSPWLWQGRTAIWTHPPSP